MSPCHMYVASQGIQVLLEAFFMFFKYKKMVFYGEQEKNSCEDGIEKCVPSHHLSSLSKPCDAWVKVFRIIPEFRILRLTFHRKSASEY